MKLAIISDTHIGDPNCALVNLPKTGAPTVGEKYEDFKRAAGEDNDYLILLGDILDFALDSYDRVYEAGRCFFEQVHEDNIAKKIIYVAGNHDFDVWHTVEHQVNVTNRLLGAEMPRSFRWSVPGVIDVRDGRSNFRLLDVGREKDDDPQDYDPHNGDPKYGGLFMDGIVEPVGSLQFSFAYPNLYLLTDDGSVLLTHGQYFEPYWALAGEWALELMQEDLRIGDAFDLSEMVAVNFPLSQLGSSGVGQAGPLSDAIRAVQRQIKDGDLRRITKYLDRLDNAIDRMTRFGWRRDKEAVTDYISNTAKKQVLEALGDIGDTRYSDEFIHRKDVLERFVRFFDASLLEIDRLNDKNPGLELDTPRSVLFGHTHQPIPWGAHGAPKTTTSRGPVRLYNTGGWLYRGDAQAEFGGAEVVVYRPRQPLKSVPIR